MNEKVTVYFSCVRKVGCTYLEIEYIIVFLIQTILLNIVSSLTGRTKHVSVSRRGNSR